MTGYVLDLCGPVITTAEQIANKPQPAFDWKGRAPVANTGHHVRALYLLLRN